MGMPDMSNQKRKKLYQTKQGLPSWLPMQWNFDNSYDVRSGLFRCWKRDCAYVRDMLREWVGFVNNVQGEAPEKCDEFLHREPGHRRFLTGIGNAISHGNPLQERVDVATRGGVCVEICHDADVWIGVNHQPLRHDLRSISGDHQSLSVPQYHDNQTLRHIRSTHLDAPVGTLRRLTADVAQRYLRHWLQAGM